MLILNWSSLHLRCLFVNLLNQFVRQPMYFNNLADLVFFQNGMLEPWLESKGLNDADQVLAYFAVSKLGEPPVDGKTDTNPDGLTAAYGKWATAIAERLHAGGLSCKVKMNFGFITTL